MGDAGMLEHCGRPRGFDDKILRGIRKNVRSDDVLLCLGDICLGHDVYWNQKLTDAIRLGGAKAILIRGNHDRKPLGFYTDNGWDFVCDSLMIKRYGYELVFSHKPVELSSPSQVNLHGHFHNTDHHPECKTDDRHMCLFMEHHYRPISLEYVTELLRKGRKFKG